MWKAAACCLCADCSLQLCAGQRETGITAVGRTSTHSDDLCDFSKKRFSLTTMHGRSQSQLVQYNNMYVII